MKKPIHPFEIARRDTAAMRKTVKEGILCKLRTAGENVTVRVTAHNSETIKGIVSNNLILSSHLGLMHNDAVEFNYSNIFSIIKE